MIKIHIKQIDFLFVLDFYDHIRSGICKYNNIPYFFYENDENNGEYYMYKLTQQEFKFHLKKHKYFEKYVGTHTNMIGFRVRTGKVRRMPDKSYKFYDIYKPENSIKRQIEFINNYKGEIYVFYT